MGKGYRHVDATEVRLVKNMSREGTPWRAIQRITGRSSSTLSKIVSAKAPLAFRLEGHRNEVVNAIAPTRLHEASRLVVKKSALRV